ncbi:MAG TPA: hypothetical protein DIV44_07405 [Leeuwenhoekiella sp.]|nr:hypothetical protein [Leeuwenhoekiella sp.]MBH12316.1 hypothetical protein [Leeuwenhoekiella sp.]HAX16585.1 hypothetical protein [Leeuwenhoekiella sp.]HBO29994.1 hypothetical protein [Leeuwenhoekiella sp.]HCQ76618.1 hypothetical protein [Leeuwenhoekiella sp.]
MRLKLLIQAAAIAFYDIKNIIKHLVSMRLGQKLNFSHFKYKQDFDLNTLEGFKNPFISVFLC